MRIYWSIRIVIISMRIAFCTFSIDEAGNFEYFRKTATNKTLLETCLN